MPLWTLTVPLLLKVAEIVEVAAEPLLVKVNDQDKFHAFPGVNKDRLAVQVATLISDEEE